MPTFTDTAGREWSIAFDGLLLKSLRDEHGINLADLGGADYARLEMDASVLTVALCGLCSAEITAKGLTRQQFVAGIAGEVLESALEAIWGAAKVFFPSRQWSALRSNYTSQKEQMESFAALPPEVKQALIAEMGQAVQGMASSALQGLGNTKSATGPAAAPLNAASA